MKNAAVSVENFQDAFGRNSKAACETWDFTNAPWIPEGDAYKENATLTAASKAIVALQHQVDHWKTMWKALDGRLGWLHNDNIRKVVKSEAETDKLAESVNDILLILGILSIARSHFVAVKMHPNDLPQQAKSLAISLKWCERTCNVDVTNVPPAMRNNMAHVFGILPDQTKSDDCSSAGPSSGVSATDTKDIAPPPAKIRKLRSPPSFMACGF